MKRIVGLVQARMGSARLPGKVMLPLVGVPLVGHIFDRLAASAGIDAIVLATTADERNDQLITYSRGRGAHVYREQLENDIAARLLGAARLCNADAILKINADCPMVDPGILEKLVAMYRANQNIDYVSNKIVWTWPEGMSAEIIGVDALEWCATNLTDVADRELVANWIKDHPTRFRSLSLEATCDYNSLYPKLSVDTPEDFAVATRIFEALYPANPVFGFDDIRRYLKQIAAEDHRVQS